MSDDQHDSEMGDFRLRGYHGIPDSEKLRAMSYIQLSEIFQSCEKDSTKLHVVEREVKRRLAKDQAEINRSNVLFGACVGGMFGLFGVVLGYYLRAEETGRQVAPASTAQQMPNSNLTVKPPLGNVALGAPTASPPASNPAPVPSNASQSTRRP